MLCRQAYMSVSSIDLLILWIDKHGHLTSYPRDLGHQPGNRKVKKTDQFRSESTTMRAWASGGEETNTSWQRECRMFSATRVQSKEER
jgi:hypothetical protein